MKIAPPDEGANRVLLKKINEHSGDITDVEKTSAVPPLTPVERKREELPRDDRQRRHEERRQRAQATLLDTRQPHERRIQERRKEDLEGTLMKPGKGIDVEA